METTADDPNTIDILIDEFDDKIKLVSIKSDDDKSPPNVDKLAMFDLKSGTVILHQTRAPLDLDTLTHLRLSHSDLTILPDNLGSLRLQHLDLSHNKFRSVPDCLMKGLGFLETLNLSHNRLESFDDEPKCVKRLRVLKIDNNKLLGIPRWVLIVNCFNLEELYYGYNEIVTLKESQFHSKSCYVLRRLELNNCFVRSQDIPILKSIRTLNALNLANEGQHKRNCFADCDSFAKLFDKPSWDDRLTILRLDNLFLSFLPENISQLAVLEELYLTGNNLYWLPDSVVTLERLRILDLSYNSISCLPKSIGSMKSLTALLVAHNSMSEPPEFLKSSSLHRLDLYNNLLEEGCGAQLVELCRFPELDFEQNFCNTGELDGHDYQKKKGALRAACDEDRNDKPKEQPPEVENSTGDTKTDSDLSFSEDLDFSGDIEERQEERWDEVCDNGCTASDNEWTGKEKFYKPRRKTNLKRYPSWMFEDAQE